ncbi:MAG: hypothetical protein NTW31_04095 [Bacteroidetes bacterium]|nr:hypothetical protein [Bacteroidota bacterium]
MSEGLIFGIMCSGTSFQKWQAEAIRLLIENGHTPALLIVDARVASPRPESKPVSKTQNYSLLWRACHRLLFKSDQKILVGMETELRAVPQMLCSVNKDNFSEYFTDSNLSAIKSRKLDFILRFGFNIIRGEILNAAKYGVWSFHHDDEQKYRGGPPGFWPVYKNDPVSAAMMQQLTAKLDAGVILKKSWMKTLFHSYKTNLDVLLMTSSTWPADMANQIMALGYNPGPPSDTNAPVYQVPGNVKMIVFLFKLLKNRIRFYWNDLFRAERWNIGIVNRSIQEITFSANPLVCEEVLWMRERSSGNYFADPGGFIEENKVHILMEDYSYSDNKANISEAVFDPVSKTFSVPLKSIETKEHLSYPFIFVYGESIYCLPESYRYGYIGLYKRNYSEGIFVEDHVLLDHIDAVDPTLINYNDKWWLFFTLRKYSNSHLYIYFADELDGEYKPHPLNPVKMDVRSSRPAGLPFFNEGELYRPSQDCSETYGRRVAINRIIKLTETEYGEELVKFIGPIKDCRYSKGFHTVSGLGRYTLIDAKRTKFNFSHFGRQARHKFRKH